MIERFGEIHAAEHLFGLLEVNAFQIGSGRPSGPRNQLWGAITQLAKAAIDGAFHRLHPASCVGGCGYTRFPGTRSKFEQFLKSHCVAIPLGNLDPGLHVALLRKPKAKSGSGSGDWVNGPRSGDEILDLLDGFNHIRNGFAHRNPRKMAVLPTTGEGLLWLRSSDSWSVQKPQALSAIRFAHVMHRYLHLCLFDEDSALRSRNELPVLLPERLSLGKFTDNNFARLNDELRDSCEYDDLSTALTTLEELRNSIMASATKEGTDGRSPASSDRLYDLLRGVDRRLGPGQGSLRLQHDD